MVFVGADDDLTDAAEFTFAANVLTVGGTGGAVVGGNLQISQNTLELFLRKVMNTESVLALFRLLSLLPE